MEKEVMVVDDEEDTLELVRLVLESAGFKVITCISGKECLEKLEETPPDAVLLDIMMPEMDGWETYQKIKDTYPNLPVAMLTAKGQNIDRLLALHKIKVDDYITKPFGKNELITRVKKITNKAVKK